MQNKFVCGGKELKRVLYYYGLIPDLDSAECKIICPFHEDVNPSMKIDLCEGRYFCFGCQESGDAFSFVKKMNPSINDLEALLKYFKILRSNKVKKIEVSNRIKTKKQSRQSYVEAYDYYHGLSRTNWFSDTSDEVEEAKTYMLKRGFSPMTLAKCRAKVNCNYSYPIIFPLLDNGKFKGWVCRTNKPEVEAKRKYLYNEGFMRRDTLAGTYGNKDYVIVVEGYMDRLKIIQNLSSLGIEEDVVAILGWKMSEEQISKLRVKGVKYVISALDNDECGRKGTDFLKTRFSVTRFCYLKGTKDPGDMSLDKFEKMYNKTIEKLTHDRRKR